MAECFYWNACLSQEMGCSTSRYATGKKKPVPIREIVVFVPSTRIPREIDIRRPLRGSLSEGLLERLASLRAKVVSLSEKWSIACSTPTANVAIEDGKISVLIGPSALLLLLCYLQYG